MRKHKPKIKVQRGKQQGICGVILRFGEKGQRRTIAGSHVTHTMAIESKRTVKRDSRSSNIDFGVQ